MPFPNHIREEALVQAHRHCCICHEFAGRSINVHHIVQECDDGLNDLENAIVLCLRCHAEAGHFNPKHPMGTKYSPSELKRHRDAWIKACTNGIAQFSACIEPTIERTYCCAELHKYSLKLTLHNGNKKLVKDWKLDIFIPYKFKVNLSELEEHIDVNINNLSYRKFQISSSEPFYLGEERQLIGSNFVYLEYDIDHALYSSREANNFKIIWRFYSDSLPPMQGELSWEEIQQF